MASTDSLCLDGAAKVAAALAEKIISNASSSNVFLNVNLPDLPLAEMKGIKVTHLAHHSHIDTVEEGHDGKRKYYWLVWQRVDRNHDESTDIGAVEQGNISITPLHNDLFNRSSPPVPESLYSGLFQELVDSQRKVDG